MATRGEWSDDLVIAEKLVHEREGTWAAARKVLNAERAVANKKSMEDASVEAYRRIQTWSVATQEVVKHEESQTTNHCYPGGH